MRESVRFGRFGAVAVMVALAATTVTACGGGDSDAAPATSTSADASTSAGASTGTPAVTASGKPSGTASATAGGSASSSAPGVPAPVTVPAVVDVASLPTTTEVKGLVIAQSVNAGKKDAGCVVLTLAPDGRLARLRTFVLGDGSAVPGSTVGPGCFTRYGFTRDYSGMVGRTAFNFKTPVDSGDPHLSLLGPGGPTDLKDISGVGGTPGVRQDGAVVDPVSGDVVHWSGTSSSTSFKLRAVKPDGTGARSLDVPGLQPPSAPGFVGGRMVPPGVAKQAAARPDGSLAVFVDASRGLHVGPVATLETNPVAEVTGSGLFQPRDFAGPNELFVGSTRQPAVVTLDTADPAHPKAAVRTLGPVPKELAGSDDALEPIAVAPDQRAAYAVVSQGADKLGRTPRLLVLRYDFGTGAVTAAAALAPAGTGGAAVLEYRQ
ncbi:hypothetical protein ACIPYS_21075 [Kitasatospora sp. NPDC089913]|uniref:hypothetical protein n=1 Tax=Kitasatospora sp. NPDC089913 TaxID=3364080 RepID=UPI003826D851